MYLLRTPMRDNAKDGSVKTLFAEQEFYISTQSIVLVATKGIRPTNVARFDAGYHMLVGGTRAFDAGPVEYTP